ncbi:MAG: cation:proton antiporter subunit C [Treponema sp.]|nr:cation:proton antiporter subunit C [Treponema sp.]
MGHNLLINYYELVAVLLFGIGFTTLFLNRNLVKKIIGVNIADGGIFLFLASKGFIHDRAPPIIVDGVQDAAAYINPIPTTLILTGIVISVSVTAFSLALMVSLYKRYSTLDLDEILARTAEEEAD